MNEFREMDVALHGLDEWRQLLHQHPEIRDPASIKALASEIGARGFECPLFNEYVGPEKIKVPENGNYREGFGYRGLNSRLRAVAKIFRDAAGDRTDLRIFAPEAVTPFALALRGRYARFLGSEYAETEEQRRGLFPIPCEDLQALTFPDAGFDFVIANEVFEHVPFLDRALAEIRRVLVPGGMLIATFPFLMTQDESNIKARLVEGKIEYLAEPEYHGNPVDPKGSLVFEIPGWNIVKRCVSAGFEHACMRFVSSPRHAAMATYLSGVLVLVARR